MVLVVVLVGRGEVDEVGVVARKPIGRIAIEYSMNKITMVLAIVTIISK